jgi:hypothetical protein
MHTLKALLQQKEDSLQQQITTIQILIQERETQKRDIIKTLSQEWDTVFKLFPHNHVIDHQTLLDFPHIVPLQQLTLSIRNSLIKETNSAWQDVKELKLELAKLQGALEAKKVKSALIFSSARNTFGATHYDNMF